MMGGMVLRPSELISVVYWIAPTTNSRGRDMIMKIGQSGIRPIMDRLHKCQDRGLEMDTSSYTYWNMFQVVVSS